MLVLADQQKLVIVSFMDAVQRIYLEWWLIGMDVETELRKSVLSVRFDDDILSHYETIEIIRFQMIIKLSRYSK